MGVPFVEDRVMGRFFAISQDGFVVMSRKGWVGQFLWGGVDGRTYTEACDEDFYGRRVTFRWHFGH